MHERQLRILTWNINGPSEARVPSIVSYIDSQGPDVIVLTEYVADNSKSIVPQLAARGWKHIIPSTEEGKENGVLVAARMEVRPTGRALRLDNTIRADVSDTYLRKRWVEVEFPNVRIMQAGASLTLGGVHIPEVGGSTTIRTQKERIKRAFWDATLVALHDRCAVPYMLIGDLNTGLPEDIVDTTTARPLAPRLANQPNTRFTYPTALTRLRDEFGWSDAWRSLHPNDYEFTFRGSRNGFRIDHAWLSPCLRLALRSAAHCMNSWDKVQINGGLVQRSDHRALIVDLAVCAA